MFTTILGCGWIKKIDNTLNKKMPLVTYVCSKVLDEPSYRGLINETNGDTLREDLQKEDCAPHAVVVSARQKIGPSCKYLVRNSWGASWHPEGVACACIEDDGTYEPICKRANPSEFVGCWYNKKDLIPNTYSITTL